MRIKDYNVLSLNRLTNTEDPRIKAIHVSNSDRWALRIQDTVVEDTGEYECQVSTANKTIVIVNLVVLGKLTYKPTPGRAFHLGVTILVLQLLVEGVNLGYLRQCKWTIESF